MIAETTTNERLIPRHGVSLTWRLLELHSTVMKWIDHLNPHHSMYRKLESASYAALRHFGDATRVKEPRVTNCLDRAKEDLDRTLEVLEALCSRGKLDATRYLEGMACVEELLREIDRLASLPRSEWADAPRPRGVPGQATSGFRRALASLVQQVEHIATGTCELDRANEGDVPWLVRSPDGTSLLWQHQWVMAAAVRGTTKPEESPPEAPG